jgi:hypothetical protein
VSVSDLWHRREASHGKLIRDEKKALPPPSDPKESFTFEFCVTCQVSQFVRVYTTLAPIPTRTPSPIAERRLIIAENGLSSDWNSQP